MIPVTREFLIYVLGALIFVMIVLITLILKKRSALMIVKDGAKDEKSQETGPSDATAIKSRISSEKPPAPPAEKKPAAQQTNEAESAASQQQTNEAESAIPPKPPEPMFKPRQEAQRKTNEAKPAPQPVFEEGVVEEGTELHDSDEDFHDDAYAPRREPAGSAAKLQQKSDGAEGDFVILGDDEHNDEEPKAFTKQDAPEPPASPKRATIPKAPQKTEKAAEVPVIKALEPKTEDEEKPEVPENAHTITAAEISSDAKTFMDQTVSVEGTLSLSTKGTDFWYVLFDDSGSVIVRSQKKIPLKNCRVIAVVKKTRLGQIYLDVLRYEKI